MPVSDLSGIWVRLLGADLVELDPGEWMGVAYPATFWRLYRNDRAGATVTVGGVRHAVRANRLFLLPAGSPFDFGTTARLNHLYVHFDVVGLTPQSMRPFRTPISLPLHAALESHAQHLLADVRLELLSSQ